MGKPVSQAAGDGTNEVALPMLVVTISILIVYLPVMFFTGIIRFLFVPLALAVTFAMMASYLASMTVAPVTINALIKAGGHHETWFDRLFTWFVDRYTEVLSWCLGHKIVVVVLSVIMLQDRALLRQHSRRNFSPK